MGLEIAFRSDPWVERILWGVVNTSLTFNDLKSRNSVLWSILLRKLKVRWVAEGNALEGSSLSVAETKSFLEEGVLVEGRPPKDFLDAQNHADAIEYLMEVLREERPISTSLIKELNALLLRGVTSTSAVDSCGRRVEKPATPGEYKKAPNHVIQPDGVVYNYVDPIHVPQEMENLVGWLNQQTDKLHPAIVAAIAHYNFVRIHPFDDGNGRGARLLMNLILLKAGIIPVVIDRNKRAEYIQYLNKANSGRLEFFIVFICREIQLFAEGIYKEFNEA